MSRGRQALHKMTNTFRKRQTEDRTRQYEMVEKQLLSQGGLRH